MAGRDVAWLCGLVLGLSGCRGARLPGEGGEPAAGKAGAPEFRVDVSLSAGAMQRMVAGRETLVVDASVYGEPRSGAPERYAKEVGGVSLGDRKVEVEPGERAGFPEIAMAPAALAEIDAAGPQLLVNVYSGRKSSPDNLLLCDIFQGPLRSARGRDLPIACRLIGE